MGIALMSDGIISGYGNLVYNNMIYDINSSSSSSLSNIGGIHLESQNNTKIYYNSVYLSGTGANQQGSGALYIWTPGFNTEVKNNIFVNTRDEGQFCASAIHLKTLNTILSSSDFNVLDYEPNNYNCLVKSNSGSYHSLSEWQATGYDHHSYVEMPHFIEPYLHINDTIATYIEARGIPITGIDTDYDGDLRNSTNPDIGADELVGVVGVEDEETFPTEFVLEQNYPNPFNPSTTFRYSIPTLTKVVIKVYDILGNEIARLMDEEKTVGTYELTWNAEGLPSGVYFYQLKAVDPSTGSGQVYVETKKMLLLK
ncbi:MAG: T9SS type A sorting domain-containing protein [Ignavibacteriaceae bacterium]|nr:T9SS type A sorting domain-containing protein [Ignavibacteriaceae bacterium]